MKNFLACLLLLLTSAMATADIGISVDGEAFLKAVQGKTINILCVKCDENLERYVNEMKSSLLKKSDSLVVDVELTGEIVVDFDQKNVLVDISKIYNVDFPLLPSVLELTSRPVPSRTSLVSTSFFERMDNSSPRINNSISTASQIGPSAGPIGYLVGAVFGYVLPYGGTKNLVEYHPGQVWIRLESLIQGGGNPSLFVASGDFSNPIDPKELVRVTLEKLGQYLRSQGVSTP